MTTTTVNLSTKLFLPCYRHLLKSTADIDFLYGGRDSGKSRHIAQQLVLDCMRLSYFRCVLARKVFNTIKESQWQLIKDVVDEWGLQDLFSFKVAPLEITCKNGNKFICRGMDEPGKMKSISNPSHCWAEEMNQMDQDDFVVIMTSLRYNAGRVKVWASFNPECDGDFHDFWLYKTFFEGHPYSFTSTWDITVPVKPEPIQVTYTYQATHTTYHDNKYCKPERAAFLEQLQIIDPYYYLVFTKGLWGNRKVEDPFCHRFDRATHTGAVSFNPLWETAASFDFNVNPITCGIYQHSGRSARGVESIKLDRSDIYKLCDYIISRYPGVVFLITGDATGKNTTALVQDGINYYTVIKAKLQLVSNQIKVPTSNPPVKENRVLVNAALHHMDIIFDTENCKNLIFDCENVTVNDMGEIEKGDRSNPKKRADHLDHFRYYLNTFHKHILKL